MSVVFPAFNEADGILQAVEGGLQALECLMRDGVIDDFELLVVDDGSTDRTAALVDAVAEQDRRVRLIRHHRNRGVGAGLRSAIDAAQGSIVLSTDADMPVDLAELRRALPLLDQPGVALVVGVRAGFDAEPAARALASRAYDRFIRLTLGVATRDVNFPFKLLRLALARDLGLRSEGALIDAELLARVERRGLGIESVVMEYRSRQFGASKTMSVRLLRQLAAEILRNRSAIVHDTGT